MMDKKWQLLPLALAAFWAVMPLAVSAAIPPEMPKSSCCEGTCPVDKNEKAPCCKAAPENQNAITVAPLRQTLPEYTVSKFSFSAPHFSSHEILSKTVLQLAGAPPPVHSGLSPPARRARGDS